MSATVAAALKKIAVAILTDKKLRKAVLGIVLGIIIIVIMPVVAVIALFNGDINIDTARLQQIVVEEMSDEEKAKLQAVENTMKAIETTMTEKGFTAERTKEAQVLYTLALYDHSKSDGFVDKLVGCFAEDQTDEQLIASVNTAFGTELKTEDFTKVMTAIRAKAINTSLKGEDIERDTERAESLLRRSAEQGNKYAAYTLGKAYLDGDILAQSIDEAVRLLNLSASKNFAPAQFILGRLLYKGEVIPKDIKKAVEWLDRAAAQKNPYAAYLAGKIYLTEDEVKNVQKAIRSFKIAATNGNDYAEYQLGKIYLYGKDIPRDTDTAIYYLQSATEHGNQYAAQLIHSIRVNGNWTAALASLRLLGHMARVIQNRLEDEHRGRENSIDRKLRRKIEEKKQAHGLKQ